MLALVFNGEKIHEDADLVLDGAHFAVEDGLATAVYISLFTDALADSDDDIPDGSADRRGFWGDAFPDVENDRIGSKIWLLQRSILTEENLRKLASYARESLQWMVDDGIASSVEADAVRVYRNTASLSVTISKGQNQLFSDRWDVQFSGAN